jgi:hypothetical protein
MKIIKLSPNEWTELRTELDKGLPGSKIAAIKIAKAARAHQQPDPVTGKLFSGVGLREAKEAVEFYMRSAGITNTDGTAAWIDGREPEARLAPMQPIKRVVCDFGDGEVALDMESMSLQVLTGLNGSMRIQDALALIDLYKRVKDWEDSLCKPPASAV